MENNTALALACVARHWAVFPCKSDKKPITPNGFKAATLDAEQVRQWWKQHPGALIGIACPPSGFFAVDLDRKNGADGIAAFDAIAKQHGGIEARGPMQTTPSGGAHILFNWPDDVEISQSAGKIALGIDVRSEGYVCTGSLPDGRAYVWNSAEGRGMDAPLTDAPAWLIDLVTVKAEAPKATPSPITAPRGDINYWLDKFLPQATLGRRNENGFNLACQVRDAGYSQAEAEALEYPERVPQGQDIYDRAEWLATVKSAYDRTPREPAKKQGIIAADPPEPEGPPEKTSQNAPGQAQPMEATKRPRYILRDAAYALQPQPPIDYIVDALITNSSVNVFYGEPGSKKTYTALSLAVCVANGKPWLDFKTKKAPVLIIDEESGERRFTRRLGEAIRGELCDTSSPIYYVSLAGFKLDDLNDPILIQALIESTGAKLVIFDALADLMDGDENDKKDVQPVFNHLRKTAENTDSAILIIHHSNKAGGYRGSSAIKGSVDLMVQVTSENGSNLINFQSEKNRDGDKAAWAAEAVWTEDEFYLKPSDRRPTESREREAYVIQYLTDHGPAFVDDLMTAAVTCSPGGAKQGLYALAKQGKVKRTNPGNRKAMYELTAPPVTRDSPVTLL